MQLAQTCFNLFLTHITQANQLEDINTQLTESLNTIKINKIKSERSENDENLHAATIKFLQTASYTHITGETLIGWTQAAERMTLNVQN